MNFLAHALVAVRTGSPTPDRVVGAVLPDLAPMAGCRLRPELLHADRPSTELLDGISCHYEADRAFHADRVFTAGAQRLRQAALRAGLPPGPSRAVGHAGWELLLDGQLLGHSEAVQAFSAALVAAPSAAKAFAPADRPRWLSFADHLAAAQWWRRYDDPSAVAEALQRRVRHRPRLAFGTGDVPLVAGVLAGELAGVAAAAGPVLDRVVDALAVAGEGRVTPSEAAARRGEESAALVASPAGP